MTNNKEEFQKKYNPKSFEEKLYTSWEKNGRFKPKISTTG
jgi:valyl-tRNA synthetase